MKTPLRFEFFVESEDHGIDAAADRSFARTRQTPPGVG
jgi:hypothetical protein